MQSNPLNSPESLTTWMLPSNSREKLNWNHGGVLVVFIVYAVAALYVSMLIAQSNPLPLFAQSQTSLPPWVFNVVWPVIVGLYTIAAYVGYVNADRWGRRWMTGLFILAILLIIIWTLVAYVAQNKTWAIIVQVILLLVTIAFIAIAFRYSDFATFCLIWPIIWLIVAFFLY